MALIGAVLGAAVILAAWWWLAGRRDDAPAPAPRTAVARAGPLEVTLVELYFPGAGGLLHAERRRMEAGEDPADRVRAVVREVLAGPRTEGLLPTLPEGIGPGLVQLSGTGTAYVDLMTPEGGAPPAMGSRGELLAAYSLVDSILVNVPEARAVVLLWNGRQPETFAGHIDTTRPLTVDRELMAPSP
jgi:hypothetical protein